MIKKLQPLFITVLISLSVSSVFGQSDTISSPDKNSKTNVKINQESSSIKFGINYLSNNVFMGRTDTVKTPAIVPELKYTLKCGVYFSGSLDYLPNKKKKRLDGGDLSTGYDFDLTDDLSGGVSYTKLFFSSTSTQIASSISSTLNASFTYDIGEIISPTIGSDYNINKQGINNDVFLIAGISHDFIDKGVFGEKDLILVSPTVTVNTGTQNFFDAYLTKKKVKNTKKSEAQNALLTQYIGQLGQFQLLDYELSAPFEYKTGHFIFQFIPTYAIVKNQLPSEVAAKISDQASIFYFQLGASLKF